MVGLVDAHRRPLARSIPGGVISRDGERVVRILGRSIRGVGRSTTGKEKEKNYETWT